MITCSSKLLGKGELSIKTNGKSITAEIHNSNEHIGQITFDVESPYNICKLFQIILNYIRF